MDTSTAELFAVIALLGVNNLVFRAPGWERMRLLFLGVQLLNMATLVFLLTIGIPGFGEATVTVNWVIGLLFMVHILTNNSRYNKALRGRSTEGSDRKRQRARMHAALRRGEE
jgi:Na+-driven multidrug efflux pump